MDPFTVSAAVLAIMEKIGMPVNLCLLGMPSSGKTSFALALQKKLVRKPAPTKEIIKIKIDKRKIDNKNYRITIYDTSGKKEDHSANIESLLKIVDSVGSQLNPFKDFLIMFFCDIKDLFDDNEYKKQVNARLKHLSSNINSHLIPRNKVLLVLTTHNIEKTNNLSEQEKEDQTLLTKKINALFIDKEYGDFPKYLLKIRDEKSVEHLLEYIPQFFPFYHNFT